MTGEWFTKDGGGYAWERQPRSTLEYLPENLDQDIGRLYALVGHANFVAGVVAQACPEAVIRVISHDGAFVEREADTPVPTEAAVARSMWLATGAMPDDGDPMTPADVINVGFAFPTLPSDDLVVNPAVGDGPESWTMNLVLECTDTDKHIFVAPAGNQSCTTPYYPAAFSRWVIGVGSARNGVTSIFSNRGSWVGFQADGETVVSTFIEWAGDTEEPDPPDTPPPVGTWTWKTFTGWAIWSGTSFAAPQIAAAAASIRAANPGATFRDTWNALRYLDSSRYAVRRQGNFRFRP